MNKQEQKRFDKLRYEAGREIDAFALEKLTYPDLLLLLKEDKNLRKLIRGITKGDKADPLEDIQPSESDKDAAEIPEEDTSLPETPAEPEAPMARAPEVLRSTLTLELALLTEVSADTEIAADWLGKTPENEGHQLVRLIARAAQWESILDLWDRLAIRCKDRKAAARQTELTMLNGCLRIHNLIWRSRQASLTHAAIGSTYDHRQHQRGTSSGENITAEWLPGLTNAGGITQRSPLVETR